MSDLSGPPDTRPPSKPPTTPPPTKALLVPGLLAEADEVLKPPARRDVPLAAVGPDGPGFTLPATPPPPRFAVIGPREPKVGDEVLVVALGEPEPIDDWRYTVPRFAEGEHRLVGRVGGPDEVEAEALARIVCSLYACKP